MFDHNLLLLFVILLGGKLHGESGKVEAVADEFIDSKEKCEEGKYLTWEKKDAYYMRIENFSPFFYLKKA